MIVIMVAILVMHMRLGMSVSMSMVAMAMIMRVVVTVIMRMPVRTMGMAMVIISAALGLEGARDNGCCAAKPTDHFREHMIIFEIERIRRQFTWRMAIADMPSGFEKAQRIFGPHLQQSLRCRFNENQTSILELNGVAIVQNGRFVEIEQKFEPLFTAQRNAAAMPALVIKAHGIDNFISLYGCFANECCSGEHRGHAFR